MIVTELIYGCEGGIRTLGSILPLATLLTSSTKGLYYRDMAVFPSYQTAHLTLE
jgi:hypothetical protein